MLVTARQAATRLPRRPRCAAGICSVFDSRSHIGSANSVSPQQPTQHVSYGHVSSSLVRGGTVFSSLVGGRKRPGGGHLSPRGASWGARGLGVRLLSSGGGVRREGKEAAVGGAAREREDNDYDDAAAPGPAEAAKPTSKFKEAVEKYGPVALTFHTSVYFASLALVYACVNRGLDLQWVTDLLPFGSLGEEGGIPKEAGDLAVAYVFNSTAIGPPRAALTAVATPLISRTQVGSEFNRTFYGQFQRMRGKSEEGAGGSPAKGSR